MVDTGAGRATLVAFQRSLGTRARRWVFAITLLAGLLTAVAMAATAEPADRTFAQFANPVHSVMSVAVPFFGIRLAHDLRHAPRPARLAPTLLAAVLLAVVVGALGDLISAGALAAVPAGTDPDPWAHFWVIAVGGVLVQIVPALLGTGLGLLLRPTLVAFPATIVLPLGLYLILAVDALHPVQTWLTPFAGVQHLLSGEMTVVRWAQWLVAALLWGAVPNAAGAARLKHLPEAAA